MTDSLLDEIDRALSELSEVERAGEDAPTVVASLRRQLAWCRAFVATGREPEPRPGPFSMGLMATREYDMYGQRPELAALINRIQYAVESRLGSRRTD